MGPLLNLKTRFSAVEFPTFVQSETLTKNEILKPRKDLQPEFESHCLLGLRASTPVVEDDQDIGESNASVTINIGRRRWVQLLQCQRWSCQV